MSSSVASMRGASRDSYAAAGARVNALLNGDGTSTLATGTVEAAVLAEDLDAIARLLGHEVSLRRLFTDPSRPPEQRTRLANALLEGKLGVVAQRLFGELVAYRWSQPRDLAIAVELLSVQAELAGAERVGELDDVEDELFRFGRIVAGEHDLAAALSARTPADARTALVDNLLEGRATGTTRRLVHRLVHDPHGRTVLDGLDEYAVLAAERRRRLVADVRSAIPLTEAQHDRLAAVLKRLYGHEVHLNVEVDPELLGGLTVRIGDEVIDGSVASRVAEVSRRLVA
jgi:F-type H+-transporting ATPase subunit delta